MNGRVRDIDRTLAAPIFLYVRRRLLGEALGRAYARISATDDRKHHMRETLIALAIAALGAGAHAAFAQPTLDFSPNRVWRNAPESTAVEKQEEAQGQRQSSGWTRRLVPAYEQEQPFVFNP